MIIPSWQTANVFFFRPADFLDLEKLMDLESQWFPLLN